PSHLGTQPDTVFQWAPSPVACEASMKVFDRYIIHSVTFVACMALILCTLMLVSVDLFANLDSYLTGDIPALTIA
uniref:hypothetical protein n=1 Tax=Salmonella enterica TaxID=28901 RepID=UPI0032989EE9